MAIILAVGEKHVAILAHLQTIHPRICMSVITTSVGFADKPVTLQRVFGLDHRVPLTLQHCS